MKKIDAVQRKIVSWANLALQLDVWREQHKKIVFTNGCFDIIHFGHIDYLSKAADMGDVLVLGLNTDASVSRIKGSERPIQDEHSRSFIMASLQFVDVVVLFDEPTPYNLINLVQPDILVKGKDYCVEDVVGYEIVTAKGGRVETVELVEGYSTTTVIQKILRTVK